MLLKMMNKNKDLPRNCAGMTCRVTTNMMMGFKEVRFSHTQRELKDEAHNLARVLVSNIAKRGRPGIKNGPQAQL